MIDLSNEIDALEKIMKREQEKNKTTATEESQLRLALDKISKESDTTYFAVQGLMLAIEALKNEQQRDEGGVATPAGKKGKRRGHKGDECADKI